jgi:16S rRNA A1518/A1519 N6-dimethyltransferase RsmA/KsgA/DIM1 with predicted DNA glycosylase/AP lyase activity
VKSAEVVLLLKKANIDPKRRAETLSLEEWAKLYKALETAKVEMDENV